MEQARIEAAQVAGAAEQRVRDLDADTDRIWMERERIVADAEDLAAQLLALAKTAAERFPADQTDPFVAPPEAAEAPVEAGAREFHDADADADEDEDEDDLEGPFIPDEPDDVEETVAFSPLD